MGLHTDLGVPTAADGSDVNYHVEPGAHREAWPSAVVDARCRLQCVPWSISNAVREGLLDQHSTH